MENLTETRLNRRNVYNGIIVNVYLEDARLCDDRVVKREVVEHPGGVAVIPVDDNKECYMIRQFRYPFQKQILEIPAGKLETGESHLNCAVRELEEETGLIADRLIDLGCSCLSPGYSTEILHIFLALDLHQGKAHPDDGEFLNVEKYSLELLRKMVMDNQIEDTKSIIAILKACEYLKY